MLARKGAAVPTGYTTMHSHDADADDVACQPTANTANTADEFGDNIAPLVAPTAAALGDPLATESGRVRISVRLDRDRHLKLRLTAAHLQNSLQDLMIDALDRYLEQIGSEVVREDCVCLGIGAAPRGWQSD